MPDTPAPQLLSPERLEEIQHRHEKWTGLLVTHGAQKFHSAHADYNKQVADLLADRLAFRQAVAEQLRGLRATAEDLCVCGSHFQPEDIDNAANALGIEL